MSRDRPFFFDRIERLEALVADAATSRTCLEAIAKELSHRSTWRARKLAAKLKVQPDLSHPMRGTEVQPDLPNQGSAHAIKISTLPISTRAQNALRVRGVRSIGELSELTEAELLRSTNVGRKTLAELRSLLERFGLRFGMELTSQERSSKMIELPAEFRVEERKDLRDALRAHVTAATSSQRNADWTIAHLGWDGAPGRTLEAIGTSANVTRERVRQIAAKCVRTMQAREQVPQALSRAITLIQEYAPMTQSKLDCLLYEHDLIEESFAVDGLRTAAKVFKIEFPFLVVEGRDTLIMPEEFATLPTTLVKMARAEIATHGAIVDDQLVELCRAARSIVIEPRLAHAILDSDGTFARLQGCEEWWWQPNRAVRGRNRLVNTVTKVLAVCERISITELREACRRHVRTDRIAPPTRAISAICSSLPFLNVCDGYVERIPNAIDWKAALSPSEEILLDIFESRGPVLSSVEITEEGIARGINENSLNIYKSYSPILWRPASGYYAVVGRDIPVGLIESLARRKADSKPTMEFGWTADYRILLARRVTDGVWLSGIVSLPLAVQEIVQGEFSMKALGKHPMGAITVKSGNAFGFKSFLRALGADVGDILIAVFDPRLKSCESWLGGAELNHVVRSGPDSIISYLSGANHEDMAA